MPPARAGRPLGKAKRCACRGTRTRKRARSESPAIATGLARQQRPSLDCGVRVVEARKRDVFGAAGV